MIKVVLYALLTSAVVFFVLSFVFERDAMDVNLHDTYFIVSLNYVILLNIVLATVTGVLYYLFFKFFKPLDCNLGLIHIILMLLAIITLCYAVKINPSPNNYHQVIISSMGLILAAVTFFVAGYLLFLVNIVMTSLKSKLSK
jgi:heme/copper-type cytochrome/quinol oxidase subunit 1